MLGVPSNGLHTNGYSLARKVLFSKYQPDDYLEQLGDTVGGTLLKVHLNYLPIIEQLVNNFPVKGLAHITGGGLWENTVRILPGGLEPHFDWENWSVPDIFTLIRETGNVPEKDMRRTFNLGIGLVVIIDPALVQPVMDFSDKFEIKITEIGEIK
jgi:phosphoribosylformylglycinamidine cyclo-ligase